MIDPKDKPDTDPMESPTWRPRPPEMDFEPIPDEISVDDDDELPGDGLVPPVPSRDEANVDPDEALPDDSEEAVLNDDLGREKIRFDEEMPKGSV